MQRGMRSAPAGLPSLLLSMLLAAAAGCGNGPISGRYRQEAGADPVGLRSAQADPAAYRGAMVVWGGEVLKVVNGRRAAELYVLETPLDAHERPVNAELSSGRFVVRTDRPLNEHLFSRGRRITVAGRVEGHVTGPVGHARYRHPLIVPRQIYIWPYRPYYPYAYPYSYGHPPYWHYRPRPGYYPRYNPGLPYPYSDRYYHPRWWGSYYYYPDDGAIVPDDADGDGEDRGQGYGGGGGEDYDNYYDDNEDGDQGFDGGFDEGLGGGEDDDGDADGDDGDGR